MKKIRKEKSIFGGKWGIDIKMIWMNGAGWLRKIKIRKKEKMKPKKKRIILIKKIKIIKIKITIMHRSNKINNKVKNKINNSKNNKKRKAFSN